MKQNILIPILTLLGLSLFCHQAKAEIAIPKELSSQCDNEELYQQLEVSSIQCYREVMNKAMAYNVLAPLVDEFGETIMSTGKTKHVTIESEKIYYHYKILMKTIHE
jgi:hypothetical protein